MGRWADWEIGGWGDGEMDRKKIQKSRSESRKSGRILVSRKLFSSFFLFLLAFSLGTLSAVAQHQHGGHSMPGMPGMEGEKKTESSIGNEESQSRTFLLDGVKAAFMIMAMADHKKMLQSMKMKIDVDPQATHNIAVTLADTRSNQPISDAAVKMKVINPQGKDQVKMLDFIMGMNQYAGDFTLSEKGKYQILILFKAGGQKRAAGFYYLLK